MSADRLMAISGRTDTGLNGRDTRHRFGFTFNNTRTWPEFGVESVAGEGTRYARFWLSPGRTATIGPTAGAEQVSATIILAGRGTVRLGRRSQQPYGVGTVAFPAAGEGMVIVAHAPTTIIHLRSLWSRFARPEMRFGLRTSEPVAADGVYSRILSSLVSSAISARAKPSDPSFPHLMRALDTIVEAVIAAHIENAEEGAESPKQRHFARAAGVMRSAYADPLTTPASVARTLGVSEKYLQAVFREMGETPARFLRDIRARSAEDLLRGRSARDARPTMAEVAATTGFGSISSLRRSLRGAPSDHRA